MDKEKINSKKAIQWALEYLVYNHQFNIINHERIVKTAYSVVYKINTTKEIIYLKQTPKLLFLEAKTLIYLNQLGCHHIPIIIAENNNLNCFLMKSCGEASLRHLFKGEIDLNKLNTGILNYTDIQRRLEANLPQLLALGIPDWRLERFPLLYQQLIKQEPLLMNDGLSKKEMIQLNEYYESCMNLCEELTKYTLPATLNHCDFHENNMLLNKNTGEISIIDWGETVISHPFFSLNGCLWNITYFYTVKQHDKLYQKLQLQCIKPWLDLYDEEQLLKALNMANQLGGVFAALSYERLYHATRIENKTVQQEHPGSIAGCLRSFLNQMHLI